MPDTLAQRIRSKYPGVYDDLPDAALEEKVRAKYPGVYDDLPRTVAQSPTAQPTQDDRSLVGDVLGGLRSSAARTVYGLSDVLIRRPLGMERVINQPDVRAAMTAPDSTAGKVASFGGDVAQFFLPTGVVGKGAKAAEVAKSAILTLGQTGSPMSAGVSGALTAVLPGGGAMNKASQSLKSGAEKSMAQALGATTKPLKREAAGLVRPMLDRGIKGSREAIYQQAKAMSDTLGQQLDQAYATAAQAGGAIPAASVKAVLGQADDAFVTVTSTGQRVPIPGTDAVRTQLEALKQFVGQIENTVGEIPIDKAAAIKQTWDDIVSKAGLFGDGPISAGDKATKRAIKTASDSFRTLINRDPAIADINKELSFWIGLRKVLHATKERTQSQQGGLTAAIAGSAPGAALGGMTGDTTWDRFQNAIIGGVLGRKLVGAVQSPAFRTSVAAPLKDALADALASGSVGNVASALAKITAALPSQIRNQPAPTAP